MVVRYLDTFPYLENPCLMSARKSLSHIREDEKSKPHLPALLAAGAWAWTWARPDQSRVLVQSWESGSNDTKEKEQEWCESFEGCNVGFWRVAGQRWYPGWRAEVWELKPPPHVVVAAVSTWTHFRVCVSSHPAECFPLSVCSESDTAAFLEIQRAS